MERTRPPTAGGKGDPTATGTATFTFDAEAERVSFTVTISGATAPFVFGHVHAGRPPDIRGFAVEFESLPVGNGTSNGSARVPLSEILGVYGNPSGYWAQLHKGSGDPTVGTIGGPLAVTP